MELQIIFIKSKKIFDKTDEKTSPESIKNSEREPFLKNLPHNAFVLDW